MLNKLDTYREYTWDVKNRLTKVEQYSGVPVSGTPTTQKTVWALTDYQNTVKMLLSKEGADIISEVLTYDLFGKPEDLSNFDPMGQPQQGSSDALSGYVRARYAGREFDYETGLQYNRARYYNPTSSRWMSEDPIGFAGGDYNLYRYCGNSPTNATDPSGNTTLGLSTLIGTGVGAVGGFFIGGLSGQSGWGWSRAFAGAGSGVIVGIGVGLLIDTWGASSIGSTALIGAGIGGGIGSAVGGGLVTSRNSTNWTGYGRGLVVGSVASGVAGATFPAISMYAGAYSSSFFGYTGTFAAGAGSAMLGDAAGQSVELAAGWRSSYDTTQTVFAGVLGGGFGVAAKGIGDTTSSVKYNLYVNGLRSQLAARTISRENYAILSRLDRIAANGGLKSTADKALESYMPYFKESYAVSAAINRRTGLVSFGQNGEVPSTIATQLKERSMLIGGANYTRKMISYNGSKAKKITVGRCAEFHSGNSALFADPAATLRDIVFSNTYRYNSTVVLYPCMHCRIMFGLDFNGSLWYK